MSRDDGQRLVGARVTAAVRCAPPENKPTTNERDECSGFLARELTLTKPRVIIALGGFAWIAVLRVLREMGYPVPRPRPRFGHSTVVVIGDVTLIGCYHPSQQNTFTGRLTEAMLDDVMAKARAH